LEYRDLSRTKAIAVANRFFRISASGGLADSRGEGERLVRSYGTFSALVASPGHKRGLVLSSTPLLVPNGRGGRTLLSLRLRDRGASFEPAHPALPLTIPKSLARGISIGGGSLSFRPVDRAQGRPASQVGNEVFFANTARDTDFYVEPTPTGVEAFWNLRSADSPETQTLQFNLPPGWSLVKSARVPGAAEIDFRSRPVLLIPPPAIHDADGISVPGTYEVAGDRLAVHVSHRGRDLRYPLQVDPLVFGLRGFYGNNPENVYPGTNQGPYSWNISGGAWSHASFPSGSGFYQFWCPAGSPYCQQSQSGLTVMSNHATAGGYYGYWFIGAGPNPNQPTSPQYTGYIYRVDLNGLYTSLATKSGISQFFFELAPHSTTDSGTGSTTTDTTPVWTYSGDQGLGDGGHMDSPGNYDIHRIATNLNGQGVSFCTNWGGTHDGGGFPGFCDPDTAALNNEAIVGLEIDSPFTSSDVPGGYIYAQVLGAAVEMNDQAPPNTVKLHNLPSSSGWIDPSPINATVSAKQPGLGLGQFSLTDSSDGSTKTWTQNVACPNGLQPTTGDGGQSISGGGYNPTQPCPESATSNSFDLSGLAEGIHTLVGHAASIVGYNADSQSTTLKIDQSRPSVSLDGSLYAARETNPDGSPNPASSSKHPLTGPAYPLRITAKDSESGVAEIDVTVTDGGTTHKTVYYGNCTQGSGANDGCDQSDTVDYLFNNYAYSQGKHTITVTAKDCLGAYAPGSTTTSMCGGSGLSASHVTTQTFAVYTAAPLSLATAQTTAQSDSLGMEPFYGYRRVATGAGSEANVNLGTGNVIWRDIPISEPDTGRLSSFVELAYNSQQRLSDLNYLSGGSDGPGTLTDVSYDQAGTGFSLGIDGLTRLNEPLDLSQADAGVISFTDVDGTRHTFTEPAGQNQWISPPGVFLHLRAWYKQNVPNLSADAWNQAWAITAPSGTTYLFDALGYESAVIDRGGNELRFNRNFVVGPLSNNATSAVCQGATPLGAGPAPVVGVGCTEQVTSVLDDQTYGDDKAESGRSVAVQYNKADEPNPGLVKSITDHAGNVTTFTYYVTHQVNGSDPDPDCVASGSDPAGYLCKVTVASGTAAQRVFKLGYGGNGDATVPGSILTAGAGLLSYLGSGTGVDSYAFPEGLTSVTDPENHTTTIQYCANGAKGEPSGCPSGNPCPQVPSNGTMPTAAADLAGLEPKCALAITDRGGGATAFSYNEQGSAAQCDSNASECTRVTGPQSNQNGDPEYWWDSLDSALRPYQHVDPLARETLTAWNNVVQSSPSPPDGGWGICSIQASQAQTCESGPGNTIAGQVKAAGKPEATTILRSYEQNGLPTEQQGPFNQSAGEDPTFRDVQVVYQESAGTPTAPSGADSGQGFVADEKSFQNANKRTTQYVLDGDDGEVKQIIAPDLTATNLGYTSNGILNSIQEPGQSASTTYNTFDQNGLPTSITVAGQSQPWTLQYDPDGNLIAVTDPRNPLPATLSGNEPTDATATSAYTTYYAYNALNQKTDEWAPQDSTLSPIVWMHSHVSYDNNGNVQTEQDPRLNTWTFTYTPMDQLASQQSPAVQDHGEQSAQAELTSYCYDAQGDLTAETLPAGQPSQCQTSGATSASNHATEWTYDADGEPLVKQQLASGNDATGQPIVQRLTSWAYDARGNPVGMADPSDNAGAGVDGAEANAQAAGNGQQGPWRTFTTYNSANQPIEVDTNLQRLDGEVSQARSQYDGDGNLVAVENPNESATANNAQAPLTSTGEFTLVGQPGMTSYTYNENGLLSSVEDPDGGLTEYARQPDGKICAVISPLGKDHGTEDNCTTTGPWKTMYSYDPEGWLTQVTLPTAPGEYSYPTGSLTVQYGRDAVGNPQMITDPRGTQINNTFFDDGALESTSAPWWWTYDPQGSGPAGPDPNTGGSGQVSAQTPQPGFAIREKSLSELYQADQGSSQPSTPPSGGVNGKFGAVASQPTPGLLPKAGQTTFGYNADMQLKAVTSASSDSGAKTTTLSYDPVGRLSSLSQPVDDADSSITSYGYDADGNLTDLTAPSVTGNNGAVSPQTTYDYTGLDQVDQVTAPGPSDTPTTTKYSRTLAPMSGGSSLKVNSSGTSYTVAERDTTIDANGNTVTQDYDPTGNLLAQTDQNGNQTLYSYDWLGDRAGAVLPSGKTQFTSTYDPAGRLTQSKDADGNPTTYSYDQNGELTQVSAPGAAKTSGTNPVAQITDYTYNGRGLRWTVTTGAGSATSGANDGQNNARTTVYETDGDGNVIRTVNPAGVQTSSDGTTGTPFNSYAGNYNTTPSSSQSDPDQTNAAANLNATINVYGTSNQLRATYLPWGCNLGSNPAQQSCTPSAPSGQWSSTQNDDTRRWVELYTHDGLGNLSSTSQVYDWTTTSHQTSSDTLYSYYANGWLQSQTNPPTGPTSQGQAQDQVSTTYSYDPSGDQTSSKVTGQANSSVSRSTTRNYWPDGQPEELKGSGTDSSGNSDSFDYTYGYRPTGELTGFDGTGTFSGSTVTQNDTVCYDPAGRLTMDTQQVGSESPISTGQTYDADGNVWTRETGGSYSGCPQDTQSGTAPAGYSGGTTSTFQYNDRNLESQMVVDGQNQPDRTYTTSYWPSGQRQQQTRQQANGSTINENWYYYDDGQPAEDNRPSQSSDVTYQYDSDGNRTQDERGNHLYNALDQEVQWTRGGPDTNQPGTTVTYAYDGAGALLQEVDGDTSQTYTPLPDLTVTVTTSATTDYCSAATAPSTVPPNAGLCQSDNGRIETASTKTTSQAVCHPADKCTSDSQQSQETKSVATYCYDPAGDMALSWSQKVLQFGDYSYSCPSDLTQAPSGSDPKTTSIYQYNALEEPISSTTWDPTLSQQVTQTNTYDALDRKTQAKNQISGQPAATSNYSYLGLSDQLAQATKPDPSNPTGVLVDNYDYNSTGQPVGLDKQTGTTSQGAQDSQGTYFSYATDANGSIVGLEDSGGQVQSDNSYHYTPFGSLELSASQAKSAEQDTSAVSSAESQLSFDAQGNDLRFEGFQGNTYTGNYDMPARDYMPSTGFFTTPDGYESSLANQALAANPSTEDPYAFADGNPTNNIETDGHILARAGGGYYPNLEGGASDYVPGTTGQTGYTYTWNSQGGLTSAQAASSDRQLINARAVVGQIMATAAPAENSPRSAASSSGCSLGFLCDVANAVSSAARFVGGVGAGAVSFVGNQGLGLFQSASSRVSCLIHGDTTCMFEQQMQGEAAAGQLITHPQDLVSQCISFAQSGGASSAGGCAAQAAELAAPVAGGLGRAGDLASLGAEDAPLAEGKVFVNGTSTANNLTPRLTDTNGLSGFDTLEGATPPGGKAQCFDIACLGEGGLGAFPDEPPPGHISIRPLEPGGLEAWLASRAAGAEAESPYTQFLQEIAEAVRRPK
jgi:RHS repeat-associated protein